MAGLRGNQAWWGYAKQSAKGTPNTVPTAAVPFTGGTLAPTRVIDSLSETDANRDAGISFVQQTAAEGSPEGYVRDAYIHQVLEAALGATAHSGSTNFTHTVTPANALPYYTFYRALGGVLWEQFNDCLVSEITFSAEAGQPLTAALSLMGRSVTRLTADPSTGLTTPTLQSGAVYNYNDAAVTLAGGATALVGSFELTISNNVTLQQTDDSIPYDLVPGQREVSLGFNLIFEDLLEYNKFHTGTTTGTTQTSNIYTTTADFTFSKGANNSVQFTLPAIAYEEFPVEPNAGGDPVTVDVRARAQRGASPVLTAVVKNQVAT